MSAVSIRSETYRSPVEGEVNSSLVSWAEPGLHLAPVLVVAEVECPHVVRERGGAGYVGVVTEPHTGHSPGPGLGSSRTLAPGSQS